MKKSSQKPPRLKLIAFNGTQHLALARNPFFPLTPEDLRSMKAAVQEASKTYIGRIKKAVQAHFGVEPGISRSYSADIVASLPKAAQKELKGLLAENRKLKKALDSAQATNNLQALQDMKGHLRKATVKMMRFMIQHKIPVIHEVSSEIAVNNLLKTFSGGLGVLNGDKIKEASDAEVPMAFFTVCPENGYGNQQINFKTRQQTFPEQSWDPLNSPLLFQLGANDLKPDSEYYESPEPLEITVPSNGFGDIKLKVMVHGVIGESGWINPIFQYTTMHSNQAEYKRQITKTLYPSGDRKLASQYCLADFTKQLSQTYGIRPAIFNLNEGHASLLPLIRFQEALEKNGVDLTQDTPDIMSQHGETVMRVLKEIQEQFSFVTHTIDAAAFDYYSEGEAEHVLPPKLMTAFYIFLNDQYPEREIFKGFVYRFGAYQINMAQIGAYLSGAINAVAEINGEIVKKDAFQNLAGRVLFITNGIHSTTWWGKATQLVRAMKPIIGDIYKDYLSAVNFLSLKTNEAFRNLLKAHHQAEKREVVPYINALIGQQLGIDHIILDDQADDTLTMVFARRAKGYKQNDLAVMEEVIERYEEISKNLKGHQKIVITFAGKPHPNDREAGQMVENILNKQREICEKTNGRVLVVYKPNYDMDDGQVFSKFDLLLANPVVGWEASGTSPMKNPLRLIMHTFDGFFAEFYRMASSIFDIKDASFGFGPKKPQKNYRLSGTKEKYAHSLANALNDVVDTFFNHPEKWVDKQIEQLAIFGMSFQMNRFLDNYLTLWNARVPLFQRTLSEIKSATQENAEPQ